MKKVFMIVAVFALVFTLCGGVQADVLSFFPPTDCCGSIGNDGGLSFDPNFYAADSYVMTERYLAYDYGWDNGYINGSVSHGTVAYNANGVPVSLSRTNGTFDFVGAYFASAWDSVLDVHIDGYLDGNLVYSQTITVNDRGPTWVQFDYAGVDTLKFVSGGSIFVMDDFTYNLVDSFNTFDSDGNCMIEDFELLSAIDDWSSGGLDDFGLLELIDFWAAGSYC